MRLCHESADSGRREGDGVDEHEVIASYRVAEYVSRSRDGAPVCWPLAPELVEGKVTFSTPYVMPTKANNARREPRVAVLFSDPTASGGSDADPLVLVQGRPEVLDSDWQHNTDRYIDEIFPLGIGPRSGRLLLRIPGLRQTTAGYLTRTWIEVQPESTLSWPRTGPIPPELEGVRPDGYRAGLATTIPVSVRQWVLRYPRPPVLAFVTPNGYPAAIRTPARILENHIELTPSVPFAPGAPGSLTFHWVRGNHRSSSSFMIRGHFDDDCRLVPERIVGNTGTVRDRLTGTSEFYRQVFTMRRKLRAEGARQGTPVPRIRRLRTRNSLEQR